MAISKDLIDFAGRALAKGRPRDDIRNALIQSGWEVTETDAALAAWADNDATGPVPRPVRSSAAKDAFFYALLFIAFGMVACNTLILAFGQIDLWLPDPGRTTNYSTVRGQRWSMAALIVFVPVFILLDRQDRRAAKANPAHTHNTVRRWISAIAMLLAVTTLLGDALYLIYTFLDGQLTARFLARSAAVALLALVVLAYFQEDRPWLAWARIAKSAWVLSTLAAATLVLAFTSFGGPAQGQTEQRDRWRIKDMRTLATDIRSCRDIDQSNLPETLDPMDCARNLNRLTAFATQVDYTRLATNRFELCTEVEFPPAITNYNIRVTGSKACSDHITK